MGAISCNGADVLELRLLLPRLGVWVADISISGEQSLVGECVIRDENLEWRGASVRSGASNGRSGARIVGGTGGLQKLVAAKSYTGASVRLVLTELLAAAGELFDADSTSAVLSRSLPYWTRPADSAGVGLSGLAESTGATWRTQANGKVWFGTDSFPKQTFQHEELDQDELAGAYVIASDKFELRPGVTFDGRAVSRVIHTVAGNEARTKYWTEIS